MRSVLRRASVAAALFFLALVAFGDVPVPPLKSRVTDLTGTLTAEQRASIEARLAAFEQRKGSQIAVLIVPTTQPETIEQYSIRVAEQWKLGRKGVDDGVLLLIAMKDRQMRIEVGYGLEGVLPDAIGKRIVAEVIAPRFKQGDFFGGIDAGVSRIMGVIEGEPLPPPKARASSQQSGANALPEVFIIGLMLVMVVGGIVRAIFGRFVGSGIVGTIGGIIAWTLLGSLIGGVIVGIIVALFSLMGAITGRGWSSGSGWSGWGGGFGGGGFSSGGGFSGGGGSFGGGGASGSW